MFATQKFKDMHTNIFWMSGEQKNYKTVLEWREIIQWARQSNDLKEAVKQSWYWWEQLRLIRSKSKFALIKV